ncbi:hypothetical protein PMO31116_01136 [Pandoraea morbifera]|uniref:Uncharacterized protein n=1 Tax=Pandoraea morbifera TaxID=2508300 RepID=A0A5E4T3E5_9BURK|nr:hypothetical protein PMO31116_01136 [Pandoraea morbifera]
MHGELRACLRQIHQLPVPTLGYLSLWLETLRVGLGADGVVAAWCVGTEVDTTEDSMSAQASSLTEWYAPQASLPACEELSVSGGPAMPAGALLPRSPSRDSLLRAHARRSKAKGGGEAAILLSRPAALDRCLPDGDLLDVCVRPFAATPDAMVDAQSTTPIGALRLLVARHPSKPRFNARDVATFEAAASEFAAPPGRPLFPPFPPPLSSTSPSSPASAATLSSSASLPSPSRPAAWRAVDDDVTGTLVWHRHQPEWADRSALALMRRVWRAAPGGAWPDACAVVHVCRSLANALMLQPPNEAGAGRQVSRAVLVPGGTLHLHATHLCGMGGRATDRVRIALHLAVPPAVRLLQRLRATALTPVQREIAMRLLAGQSRAQTREACAIGVQTLKTHLSLMRARLDPVRDAPLLAGLGRAGVGAG